MAIHSLFIKQKSDYFPFLTDGFITANHKRLEICFIRHASLIISFDDKIIYIDPLSEFADLRAFPPADIIIVTHGHSDHFDPAAIGTIIKPETILFVNQEVTERLQEPKINLTAENTGDLINSKPAIITMHNGNSKDIGDWGHITAVPAYNTTPGRDKYHPRGRDNGYLLSLGESILYISGDTEDIPELNRFGPIDIAFIPVNQPYTMTIEQAVHAIEILRPSIAYPYHYGDTNIERLCTIWENKTTEIRLRNMP